jgi:hypothetical protein
MRRRNLATDPIERMFGHLKDFRRIATRYGSKHCFERWLPTSSPPSNSPQPSAIGCESGPWRQ